MASFKQFCEEAEIKYHLYAEVNGEQVAQVWERFLDNLEGDFGKVQLAVNKELEKQFNDLPENLDKEYNDED